VNFTLVMLPVQPTYLQFLGPGATVIASIVAGWLAFRLQGLQAAIGASQIEVAQASKEIAKLQADVAFDALKLNLFNRRFELYTEALKIAVETMNSYYSGISVQVTYERLDKLNEAAFIFSSDPASRIETIRAAVENIGVYSARLEKMKKEESPQVEEQEKLIFTQLNLLTTAAADLRRAIKHDMSFVHLLPRTEPNGT
jgi:hypothetical protein